MSQSVGCHRDTFMQNYCPISSSNAYGAIPLIGFVASCLNAGLLTRHVQNAARNPWFRDTASVQIWFSIGLFVFAISQVLWGFHVKRPQFLLIWIICKVIEVISVVYSIVFASIDSSNGGLIAFSAITLIIIIPLIYIAYIKYRDLTKAPMNGLLNYLNTDTKIPL